MMYNCNIVSIFLRGYRGKTIDFAEVSCQHRTTTAYFLNHGKWNDSELQDVLKRSVIQIIYRGGHCSLVSLFSVYHCFAYKTLVTGIWQRQHFRAGNIGERMLSSASNSRCLSENDYCQNQTSKI